MTSGLASEELMARLRAGLAAADAELRPLGRPSSSSCRCAGWPCPCVCHKYDANRAKSGAPPASSPGARR